MIGPNTDAPWQADISQLSRETFEALSLLDVTEGPLIGEPLEIIDFQQSFINGVVKNYNTKSVLTVARGNGKTALAAALCLSSFIGPLSFPRSATFLAATMLGQTRVCFDHIVAFFRQIVPDEEIGSKRGQRFRMQNNTLYREIEDRETGCVLRAIGRDPKSAHGLAPSLIVADEPAQWLENYRDGMYEALTTGLGKQPASWFIAIGTQSTDPYHWMSKLIRMGNSDNRNILKYSADDPNEIGEGYDDFAEDQIRKANPAYDYFPSLREQLKIEASEAKNDPTLLAGWRSYRLNLGSSVSGQRNRLPVFDVRKWKACERPDSQMPERDGPVAIAFDMGGSASMTAWAGYWPMTGRLEVWGAFCDAPPLDERGKIDGVGDLYVKMFNRGELMVYPGFVTPLYPFIRDVEKHIEGEEVISCTLDRFRQAEAEQAFGEVGVFHKWGWDWRGVGSGKDGSADIRHTQAEVLEGRVRLRESLLLTHSIADAIIKLDTNQNPSLDKSRHGSRIDPLQVTILAISAGRRWRLPTPSEEQSPLQRYYSEGGLMRVV